MIILVLVYYIYGLLNHKCKLISVGILVIKVKDGFYIFSFVLQLLSLSLMLSLSLLLLLFPAFMAEAENEGILE